MCYLIIVWFRAFVATLWYCERFVAIRHNTDDNKVYHTIQEAGIGTHAITGEDSRLCVSWNNRITFHGHPTVLIQITPTILE